MAKPTATTLTRNLRLLPTAAANTRTGVFGEIGYDRERSTLIIYDGITQGGFPLLRADLNNLEGSVINVKGSVFADDSTLLVDAVDGKIRGPVETTTVSASLGFTGNLNGNVSGNLTGNVTGNVSGNLSGNVTGNVNGNITSTGISSFSNIDINGGSIDGTPIGTTSRSTIQGTTISATEKFSGNLEGNVTGNVSGNAGTVTNGIYTNQTYTDPTWLTINLSKISFTTGPSLAYTGTGTNFGVRSIITNLDFGSTPVSSKTFTVAEASATTGSKIMVFAHPSTANGAFGGDELEMDPISISGVCNTNGFITFYAAASQGPVSGSRNFHYVVV